MKFFTRMASGIIPALALIATTAMANAQSATRLFHIHFSAVVGAAPFACGKSYPDIGADGVTIVPQTFRFYVSDVSLVDAHGNPTPLQLDQDGTWQRDNVAFINFDDNMHCSSGTLEKRDEIVGSAAAGNYVGIRFTIGVPEKLDHADATIAQSPLNLSEMFWNWQDGYKFFRFDTRVVPVATNAKPSTYIFHLGSTDCSTAGKNTRCSDSNRPDIALDHFNPQTNTIAVDIAALLRTTDLTHAGGGCMSDGSASCAPAMQALGLMPSTPQSIFTVR